MIYPWPHCDRHWYSVWYQILYRAGIPAKRWFGLHGLRKATGTELADISPLASQLVLGHSEFKTTQKHYINPKLQDAALARLPQPVWKRDEQQLRLF